MTTSVLHEFSRRGTAVHRIALIDGPNMSNLGHRSKKADGPNQVAVNPFGRLVDELKDGTFVVRDKCLDLDAEAFAARAHVLVQGLYRGFGAEGQTSKADARAA